MLTASGDCASRLLQFWLPLSWLWLMGDIMIAINVVTCLIKSAWLKKLIKHILKVFLLYNWGYLTIKFCLVFLFRVPWESNEQRVMAFECSSCKGEVEEDDKVMQCDFWCLRGPNTLGDALYDALSNSRSKVLLHICTKCLAYSLNVYLSSS